MDGSNLKLGNTRCFEGAIYLHNNKIAEYRADGLWITNAGWQSNTTKERLNGLPFVYISQRNFKWYLNGTSWDGSWIRVSDISNPSWRHLNTLCDIQRGGIGFFIPRLPQQCQRFLSLVGR